MQEPHGPASPLAPTALLSLLATGLCLLTERYRRVQVSVGKVGMAAPEAQAEAWLLFPSRCSERALEWVGRPSEKALCGYS